MPSSKTAPKASPPSEETIRKRAYELYLERGATPGLEMEDWERARQELIPQPRRKRKV